MSTSYDSMSNPPSKGASSSGGGWKVVVIILAVLAGLGVFSCLCCGGLSYFGFQAGMDEVSRQVKEKVEDNPIVQEKIGTIETSKVNFMATGEAQQETGEQVMVLDVSGPNGSGQLLLKQVGTDFEWIRLRTDDGEWVVYGEDLDEEATETVEEVMEEETLEVETPETENPIEPAP